MIAVFAAGANVREKFANSPRIREDLNPRIMTVSVASISVADSQDNFAVGVTRFTELVRAAHFRKRQDAIDHRREFARVDDLRDLGQLSTARVASHKCGADAERFRFLIRWRLHQRNQNTALFQYRPGTLLRFAADEVEHNIDIARHVFEFLFRVIDRFVHSELAQQFLIFGGRRRENVRAFPFCQLHGKVTNSAAAGVNQHALAWLQLRLCRTMIATRSAQPKARPPRGCDEASSV